MSSVDVGMDRPVRVGLLIDADTVPFWVAEIVRRLVASDAATVDLVVRNRLPGQPAQLQDVTYPAGSVALTLRKLKRNASQLAYIGFGRLDRSLKRSEHHFEHPCPIAELLPDAQVIDVEPVKTEFSDYLSDEDVATIRAADMDVLFRVGFRILRGGILDAARFGIWSYHHGDNRQMRGGPSNFWELTSQAPVVGVILQRLNEDLDGGQVLSRSWHRPDILLLNRQRQNVFMQALSHLPRQIERLHALGPDRYEAEVEQRNRHPDFYSHRLFVAPRNAMAAWAIGGHYLRYLREKLVKLFFFRQWILLASLRPNDQPTLSMWRFRQVLPPRDRCWADPFVIERDGQYHVFVEELVYETGRGRISVMPVDETGQFGEPVPVLEEPYHMSYPFLFEHGNELYMVPETGENRTVDLYRCTGFPERWEFVRTLMDDVFAVDATLVQHEGRWWMFVTLRENEHTDCLDELHLFHTDDPTSTDWAPHPLNPVSTDVRNARPAGAIIERDGELYRPAQNGAYRYGYGMKFNHIELLTLEDYRERVVSEVTPDWDWSLNACHTVNHVGRLTVSDASKLRFRYFRDRQASSSDERVTSGRVALAPRSN